MTKLALALFFLFLPCLFTASYATEQIPSSLISVTSLPGVFLLKKDLNENTVKLLSHFTTQKTNTYCGVASIVMVLNSTDLLPPKDALHPPFKYFTQDNFFNDSVKKIIAPEEVSQKGISLSKLQKIIESYDLKTELYFADQLTLVKFRQLLRSAIRDGHFIIVNFLRTALHQEGGGHHSPIAAYDANTDRFLILDVARYKYPAYWVKTEDLWKAASTLDENHSRGFVVVRSIIQQHLPHFGKTAKSNVAPMNKGASALK